MAAILALASVTTFSFAASTSFTDVPSNHWAKASIDRISDCGLMSGYGNGKFGPEDTLTIAQMATIICRAKGYPLRSRNEYWAYDAIYYCIYEFKCYPWMGNVIDEWHYDIPCTREVAYHMMMNGLVGGSALPVRNITAADIPDYEDISKSYRDAVLKAYQCGLTSGYSSMGEFNPQGELTRAQAAAMLVRAGFVNAAPPAQRESGSSLALLDKIYETGEWREYMYNDGLRAKETKYADMSIGLAGKYLLIDMTEQHVGYSIKNNHYIDVNGNYVPDQYNEKGVYVCPSGYSYESRLLLKRVLQNVFGDKYEEAYNAVKQCFLDNIHEDIDCCRPSAVRYIDDRYFHASFGDHDYEFHIVIGPKGSYQKYLDTIEQEGDQVIYEWYNMDSQYHDKNVAFELHKW